jgi:hypothetical protein
MTKPITFLRKPFLLIWVLFVGLSLVGIDDAMAGNFEGPKNALTANFNLDFKVYPNPYQGGMINLEIEGMNNRPVEVALYNVIGRVIYKQKYLPHEQGAAHVSFEPSEKLIPGMYFVSVSSNEYVVAKKLIVKE